MISLTAGQMKRVDDLTMAMGIDLMQLMEIASYHIAELAKRLARGNKISILCGKGNNGGDGIVAARHLADWGFDVDVVLAYPENKLKPMLRKQVEILERIKVNAIVFNKAKTGTISGLLDSADLIIDALLGYSLQGSPRFPVDELINAANRSKRPVLAVDLPSGLDATTGKINLPTIKARWTLTLALPKTGLSRARQVVGSLYLCDIGIPRAVYKKMGLKAGNIFRKKSIIRLLAA